MKKAVLLALLALVTMAPASLASVIVGAWDSGNCYPFSCGASDDVLVYQQVYSAAEFSGPLSFNQINFFRDPSYPGLMDSATYDVSFSTTSKAVMGLDSNYLLNIGADAAVFGSYTLGGQMPETLTLMGSTFSYNPAMGNLLMTVLVSNLTVSNTYQSFFKADYTGTETSRLYEKTSGVTANVQGALVTEFVTSNVVVPEPSTFALLGLGLAGLTLARRKK